MSVLLFSNFGKTVLRRDGLAQSVTEIISCNASSGKKGNTKNTSRPNRRRNRGWKVQEGDMVHRGYILARQIHKFRWLPGANVIVGRRMTFSAGCTGTIRFTKEIFIPQEDQPLAETVCSFPKGALLYKTTINVVPPRDIGRYRLVELV